VHLHSLESRLQRAWGDAFAGGSELQRLADGGVLGARSALAHGVWLRDSDIDLLARCGTTVVHNPSSNLRLAAGVAPLRQLVAAGVDVAVGLDDMGIADDDDMFAELRMAHALQRVHGEARHPRLTAARVFGLGWDGGANVVGAASSIGRLEAGRRGDVVVLDLEALRAPFAVDDADIWELLVSRAKASHVRSVIVEGRPLLLDGTLQHIDRPALMAEVAAAAASAVARRGTQDGDWMAQIRHRIAEHYQAPVWHSGSS
jgi:cytosine/adenosine deaminase-related metal-dependent hydrolase